MEGQILTNTQVLLLAWLGNGALLGIAVTILGKMINNLKDYIEKTCRLKHSNVDKAIEALAREDEALWDAFNKHGHKGLSNADSKVVRG